MSSREKFEVARVEPSELFGFSALYGGDVKPTTHKTMTAGSDTYDGADGSAGPLTDAEDDYR
jgi:hypothetical protein